MKQAADNRTIDLLPDPYEDAAQRLRDTVDRKACEIAEFIRRSAAQRAR